MFVSTVPLAQKIGHRLCFFLLYKKLKKYRVTQYEMAAAADHAAAAALQRVMDDEEDIPGKPCLVSHIHLPGGEAKLLFHGTELERLERLTSRRKLSKFGGTRYTTTIGDIILDIGRRSTDDDLMSGTAHFVRYQICLILTDERPFPRIFGALCEAVLSATDDLINEPKEIPGILLSRVSVKLIDQEDIPVTRYYNGGKRGWKRVKSNRPMLQFSKFMEDTTVEDGMIVHTGGVLPFRKVVVQVYQIGKDCFAGAAYFIGSYGDRVSQDIKITTNNAEEEVGITQALNNIYKAMIIVTKRACQQKRLAEEGDYFTVKLAPEFDTLRVEPVADLTLFVFNM